ncbi:hypothetical protein GZH53_19105 [Flavihumibacter sp. R14]|nr:hypothetical protein [Flavihumibacter soli]
MALKSGTSSDFESSMAKAMEDAFTEEWPNLMDGDPPPANSQTKLLYLAIAKGVVRHLLEHPEAFEIRTTIGSEEYRASVKITG